MKTLAILSVAIATLATSVVPSYSHCEIPCGIYGDKMRLDTIVEHITTIEKSMQQIANPTTAGTTNYNQLVRWVNNKETHANEIQHIVTQYFLTQRIKSSQEQYSEHLKMLHEMLVLAMKCKQTTDLNNATQLREATRAFRASYLGDAGEAHQH